MALRTSGEKVKKIIKTSLSNAEVAEFCTAANLIVTNSLAGRGLSDSMLEEIERYLSAHFLASSNMQRELKSQKIDDATETYGGQFGKGLQFTSYGQMVLTLDTTKTLSNLGKLSAKIETLFDPKGLHNGISG